MKSIRSRLKQPHELLNHILDQPELPAIIQRLDPGVLTKLIRHVGLEDSAEIVSLATVEQLKGVFDEDLWYSEAPGREETFDAARFGLWLEILFETGVDFAARKVMELDEDLVTLALTRLVLVIDIDELALRMSNGFRSAEDDLVDKVLESSLNQEFENYWVISRSHAHWEAVQALLAELNELDYAMLNRLLERCCRISWQYIEDHGGFLGVFSAEETLEADMAAEREQRRESKGYVSAAAAAEFLSRPRTLSLKKIIAAKSLDPVSRAYFKAAAAQTDVSSSGSSSGPRDTAGTAGNVSQNGSDAKVVRFLRTLQEADVLPAAEQKKLGRAAESWDHHLPLAKAMRVIHRTDAGLYAQRLLELTYLSNVLMAGCGFQGRAFRPVEAAEAAFSVCNLGGEHMLGAHMLGDREKTAKKGLVEPLTALLTEHHLVKLFQVGWKILYDDVVLKTGKAVSQFLDGLDAGRPDGSRACETAGMADAVRACLAAGRPWAFARRLDRLYAELDGETIAALTALLQEYPTMSAAVREHGKHDRIFIWTRVHLRTIKAYLEQVLLQH